MEDIQFNKVNVGVVGAGGLGREIDSWICGDKDSNLSVICFWDDNLGALDNYSIDKKVLGNLDSTSISGDLLLGIMDCDFKQKIFERFVTNPNISIISYVHSSVAIGKRSRLGKGVVVFPNVIISCDVSVGDATFLNLGTQVGHDVRIGNYVSVMPNVDIGGGVVIGDNVFIGSGATILPGIKIVANTRIGAGSVVIKSIKKEGTYFGNPAKKIF